MARLPDDAVEMRPDHDTSCSFARASAWNQKTTNSVLRYSKYITRTAALVYFYYTKSRIREQTNVCDTKGHLPTVNAYIGAVGVS